jgi:hypothetical protein
VKAYVEPVGGEYDIKALFSVDDKLPLLGGAAGHQYRMVGIPDGLGAHPNSDGTRTLFMNHELGFTALSELVESSGGNARNSSIPSATQARRRLRTSAGARWKRKPTVPSTTAASAISSSVSFESLHLFRAPSRPENSGRRVDFHGEHEEVIAFGAIDPLPTRWRCF